MCNLRARDYVEWIGPVHDQGPNMPDRRRLYTVASVRPVDGGHCVRLNELAPECRSGGACACACGECGWDSRRFRLVYRPTPDKIAVLTALLDSPLPCEIPPAAPRK